MALVDAEKAQIRLYLGYSGRYWDTITILEMAMDAVSGDMEVLVRDLLESLADIDAKLVSSHGRLKAIKAEDVTLPGPQEISMLRSEGRRFVVRLASVLGVAPRADMFGTSAAGIGVAEGALGPFVGGGGGGNYTPQG